MYNPVVVGFVLMISGALLAYFSLADKQGRSPFFVARSGLVVIYPAIILVLFAFGFGEVVIAVMAGAAKQ